MNTWHGLMGLYVSDLNKKQMNAAFLSLSDQLCHDQTAVGRLPHCVTKFD